MTQHIKDQDHKQEQTRPFPFPLPGQNHPSSVEALNKQKLKTDALEVAGRHKNDGQKDHKGAR